MNAGCIPGVPPACGILLAADLKLISDSALAWLIVLEGPKL